jgi:hypothetical protein
LPGARLRGARPQRGLAAQSLLIDIVSNGPSITRQLGGNYGGTSTEGGYSIGFVTGSVGSFDRVDAPENTLRACLGLPALTEQG